MRLRPRTFAIRTAGSLRSSRRLISLPTLRIRSCEFERAGPRQADLTMQRPVLPRLTPREILEFEEGIVENFDQLWAAGYVNGAVENPEHQDLFMAQLLVQGDQRLAPLLPLLQTLINTFQTNTIDWVKQVLREQQALVQSNAPITEQKYQVMITHFRGMENVSEVFCNLEFVTKLGLERLPEDGPRKYLQKRLLYMCFGIITCVEQKARCVEIASGNANNNNTRLATLVMNVLVLKKEVQCLRQKVAKKKGCLFLSQAEQQNQVRLFDAENELKEARKALDAAKSQLRDSATVTAPVTEILRSTLEKALDAVNFCKKLYTGLDLKFGNRWLPYWIGLVESVFAESASALAGRLVKQLLTPEDRAAGAMDAACVTALKAFVNQVGREYEASDGWDEEDVVDAQLAEELNHDFPTAGDDASKWQEPFLSLRGTKDRNGQKSQHEAILAVLSPEAKTMIGLINEFVPFSPAKKRPKLRRNASRRWPST